MQFGGQVSKFSRNKLLSALLKTTIVHWCKTCVRIYQTTCCNIQEHSNLHKNTPGVYNADLFEVTADGIHCYDCTKSCSDIILPVIQHSVKPGTNVFKSHRTAQKITHSDQGGEDVSGIATF